MCDVINCLNCSISDGIKSVLQVELDELEERHRKLGSLADDMGAVFDEFIDHASKCKRVHDECDTCQLIIDAFDECYDKAAKLM